jgi:hypothetical protein
MNIILAGANKQTKNELSRSRKMPLAKSGKIAQQFETTMFISDYRKGTKAKIGNGLPKAARQERRR